MTYQPILVIGATGKTGSRVVSKLEAKGVAVRRGARRSETPFDWEDTATWAPALSGVSKAYVTYFHDSFLSARSELETLKPLTEALGIFHSVEQTENGEYQVQHSGVLTLIDPAGRFSGLFSSPHDSAQIAHDLTALINNG